MTWVLVIFAETTSSGGEADQSARFEFQPYLLLIGAIALGAIGLGLMLPPGGRRGQLAGAAVSVVGLVLLVVHLLRLGSGDVQVMFWLLASLTVISAVATITMRSPVYSAIWFALTLLTTAGLFLLQGAQFLSVATVIVYAGAILVTFLFVLMLAQPEGHAYYDRISWGPLAPVFGTLCGALLIGGLTFTLTNLEASQIGSSASLFRADAGEKNVLQEDHMARLGAELFGSHLVSVEVAGTLLLVALVGAIAIVAHSQQSRPSGGETDSNNGKAAA